MRLRHSIPALLVLASARPAAAAPTTVLDPVIVTASRSEEALSDTLAPVTVITRADIERLQPFDFQDLLAGLPGVSLASNGGSGKSTSLHLRGTNADHVIVLVDGLKIGSATLGTTAFEQIPVDQIERVEIVRGPRSSLYGSEAIGGVVQIFTRRGRTGEGVTPSFAIGGGNRDSGKFEAGIRGGVGSGGWYSLGASGLTTDGINVQPAGSEPDRDGFRSLAGSLATGWRFAGGAEISANWLRADSHNDYDGSFTNEADNIQQVFGARARFSPLAPWQVTLAAGESQDLSDNFHDPEVPDFVTGAPTDNRSGINTFRDSYSWQNDLRLAEGHLLNAGVDYQHDRVSGTVDYDVDSRDDTGVFGQYHGHFGRHELQASARHDDNEQFGSHKTGAAAYGYRFGNGIRVGASYGTAFKAPTFNQLYFPFFGDPTLEPERARSAELNLGGRHAAGALLWNWALNGYHTDVDNLIDFVPPTFAPENIGKARILGVEAQLGGQWQGWRAQTFLNWLDPENRSDGANRGNTLQRRARRSARIDVDYDFARTTLGATLYGAGTRYNDPANSTQLGGYATLDLRAGWNFLPQWQLQLKAANVLDKTYETVDGYAQPGDSYFLTLRYTP